MKAFLLCCLLLLSSFSLLTGQERDSKLGLSLIPEVSKPFLQNDNAPYSFHSRLSYTGKFGLQFQQALTDKINLRTGLLYVTERYNIDVYNIYLESNNFAIETEIQEEIQLGSLLFPLQLQYLFNEHWSVFSGLGIQLPFYDQRYRYFKNAGEEKPSLFEQDREIQKSWAAFSIGVSRTIRKKFLDIEISPQIWLHTHRAKVPLQAVTNIQMTAGVELTAWIF